LDLLASDDDQPCVFNWLKHKSQTAVEVKTSNSDVKMCDPASLS